VCYAKAIRAAIEHVVEAAAQSGLEVDVSRIGLVGDHPSPKTSL
jgi:hypothetical protein